MVTSQDIILYKNISCPSELLKQIEIIATHTKNTWQSNRSLDDIIRDTTIGKIAEYTLKEHIAKHSDYAILDYDDFRVDNYKKHAPLDCIIFKKENPDLQLAINTINLDATNNSNGAMSDKTKNLLKNLKISTMEIKSTRITNRHKANGVIKRMPQYGKSEQALYIATQIRNGTKFN